MKNNYILIVALATIFISSNLYAQKANNKLQSTTVIYDFESLTNVTAINGQDNWKVQDEGSSTSITSATIPVNGSEVTIDNTAPKATALEGTVTINISPTLTLPSNTDLYVVIPTGTFTDAAGNAFAGLSTNTLWNFSTDTVLGIQNNIIKGFTLFPNPVIDVLNISAQENLKTIQVFNLMGQQVFQKNINSNKTTLNLNRLPQGTYFVKVTTDKTAKAVKLIKR